VESLAGQRKLRDGWPAQSTSHILGSHLPSGYAEIAFIFTSDVLRVSKRKEPTEAVHRKEWLKLGWSEAKVSRALNDMRRANSNRFYGLHDELRNWIASTANSLGPVLLFAYELPCDTPAMEERMAVKAGDLLVDSSIVQFNRLVEVRADSDGAG
jgi:hypothetical protein